MADEREIKVAKKVDRDAKHDEDSMRSLEMSQMRILARKRPREYLKIAREEIHLDLNAGLTA